MGLIMSKFTVDKTEQGKELSIFKQGLPKLVVLSNDLSQAILKALFELGVEGIKNGSDNEK